MMVKRFVSCLVAMICLSMLLIGLVGCGPDNRASFAGDWHVVAMQDAEGNDLTADLEQLAAAGIYFTLSLSEETDDAVLELADQHTFEGTWKPKGEATCVIDFEGCKQLDATLSEDGTLVFEHNGQTMTCEKIEFGDAETGEGATE